MEIYKLTMKKKLRNKKRINNNKKKLNIRMSNFASEYIQGRREHLTRYILT